MDCNSLSALFRTSVISYPQFNQIETLGRSKHLQSAGADDGEDSKLPVDYKVLELEFLMVVEVRT